MRPRFDAPSVFRAPLDRDAGTLPRRPRTGALADQLPLRPRHADPWRRPGSPKTGWLVVHDALTIDRWEHRAGGAGAPAPAPTEHESDRSLLRMIDLHRRARTRSGWSALRCSPTAPSPATWSGGELGEAAAVSPSGGSGPELRLTIDMRPQDRRRHLPRPGISLREDEHAASALSPGTTGRSRRAALRSRGARAARVDGASSGGSGCATGSSPTTRGGSTCSARRWSSRASPTLRRARSSPRPPPRCRFARRRAQLGLPLLLDPRRHLHPLGPAHARLRRRGR